MSKANTGDSKLDDILEEIFNRLSALEQPQRNRLPMYAADPASPRNGDAWFNTTSNQLKIRVSGVTKVVTFT